MTETTPVIPLPMCGTFSTFFSLLFFSGSFFVVHVYGAPLVHDDSRLLMPCDVALVSTKGRNGSSEAVCPCPHSIPTTVLALKSRSKAM